MVYLETCQLSMMGRFVKIVAVNFFLQKFPSGMSDKFMQSAMCLLLGLIISLAGLN